MSDFFNKPEGQDSNIAETTAIPLPPQKNVVFYNDDYTTMEFVVDVLISVYGKSHDAAHALMMEVHHNGSAIVGTYTYDIAVSRALLTTNLAKQNGFPLRVEVE